MNTYRAGEVVNSPVLCSLHLSLASTVNRNFVSKTYTAKKGYLLYMLEKGNLLREDDTSDHNRLVRVLVIAVLIGKHLDRDEGDERLVCHEKSCTILEK